MMHLMVCVGRRANAIVRLWLTPIGALTGYLADVARTREELLAENALLRQQLLVLQRQSKKPKLRTLDRVILLICARLTKTWQSATWIVKPATVLRWHRQGFRLFWRHKSRCPRQRGPRLQQETIELIRHMARNDRLWGAERIRGELLKLGIRVSKRTIQKYFARSARYDASRPILENVSAEPLARDLGRGLSATVRCLVSSDFCFLHSGAGHTTCCRRRRDSQPYVDVDCAAVAQRDRMGHRASLHHSRSGRQVWSRL
jgi:hypothetical protein